MESMDHSPVTDECEKSASSYMAPPLRTTPGEMSANTPGPRMSLLAPPGPREAWRYLRHNGPRRALAKLVTGYVAGSQRWHVTFEDLTRYADRPNDADDLEFRFGRADDVPPKGLGPQEAEVVAVVMDPRTETPAVVLEGKRDHRRPRRRRAGLLPVPFDARASGGGGLHPSRAGTALHGGRVHGSRLPAARHHSPDGRRDGAAAARARRPRSRRHPPRGQPRHDRRGARQGDRAGGDGDADASSMESVVRLEPG